jgi:hypothetical protein
MKEGVPEREEDKTEKELSNLERLVEYEKQGYVFHGSSRKDIEILQPRLSRDVREGRDFNNDTAVFGTERADEAIIYACVDRSAMPKEIERNMSWSVGSSPDSSYIIARIPIECKPYVIKGSGHIYVFNKEHFTLKRHWHVKSKESVKPIDKIEVEFKDFEKLGGIVEWKEGGNIKGTED